VECSTKARSLVRNLHTKRSHLGAARAYIRNQHKQRCTPQNALGVSVHPASLLRLSAMLCVMKPKHTHAHTGGNSLGCACCLSLILCLHALNAALLRYTHAPFQLGLAEHGVVAVQLCPVVWCQLRQRDLMVLSQLISTQRRQPLQHLLPAHHTAQHSTAQ